MNTLLFFIMIVQAFFNRQMTTDDFARQMKASMRQLLEENSSTLLPLQDWTEIEESVITVVCYLRFRFITKRNLNVRHFDR